MTTVWIENMALKTTFDSNAASVLSQHLLEWGNEIVSKKNDMKNNPIIRILKVFLKPHTVLDTFIHLLEYGNEILWAG